MPAVGERTAPAAQWAALARLLDSARAGNPFYRRKWTGLSFPHSLEDFFGRWPFTTKSELVAAQALSPPYGDARSLPLSHYTRLHQTSGTTGEPLRWLDTPESWSGMVDDWAVVLTAAGVQPRIESSSPSALGRSLGSGLPLRPHSGWAASRFPGVA